MTLLPVARVLSAIEEQEQGAGRPSPARELAGGSACRCRRGAMTRRRVTARSVSLPGEEGEARRLGTRERVPWIFVVVVRLRTEVVS